MTLIAMVLGLVAVLLFGGFVTDIKHGLQSEFVRRTGHLQVQQKDYFRLGSGNPTAYGIANYERIIAAIQQDPVLAPMLAVLTPTLQFGGIAGNFSAGVSRTVFVNGVVVDDQNRMRSWNDYQMRVLSQNLSLSGSAPDAAVIGTGVARVLELCTALKVPDCEAADAAPVPVPVPEEAATPGGDLPADIASLSVPKAPVAKGGSTGGEQRIELLAGNARGAPNVATVNVMRAEFQGMKELDDVYVGLHLSQAQKLIFGSRPPQVTAIVLQLQHTSQIPTARARLDNILKTTLKDEPLTVFDYEELNPYYGQALSMFGSIFGFISILIGGIVLFTVTNTMSMAVVERTVEIGTLRAIGLRKKGIKTMFVTEGVVLGCFGAVLGIGAAIGCAWIINHLGLTWIAPGRIEPSPLAVSLSGEHTMMIVSAVGLMVVASLSSILPASRAARMNIVDALRHV